MRIRKINLNREKASSFSRQKFLRLDKNEKVNFFEKRLLKEIKLNSFDLTAYPEVGNIYKKIAKINKIKVENLILTAGSEFGYRMCFEYFCNKKSNVLLLNPTFGMAEVYSQLFNVKQIKIGYDKNLNLNFDKLIQNINKKISLIIIANPNSPTGTIIEKKGMIEILKRSNAKGIPILLDEAYYGFYNKSYIKKIKKYKNLLILRTFSKSFGLAGMRAGFLAGNAKLIKELSKFKPMYEINSIACKILNLFLSNNKIEKKNINQVNAGKLFIENYLKKKGIHFFKSYGNFIHINLEKKKKIIEKELYKSNILTRKGPGVKGLEKYLRITLGPKLQMQTVTKVINKFF